ncbi:hypothetical protein V1498_06685 [Peribacillus sp. SCS-26]|uniref:hypothetical protein n=1 Tax=Paraperibacillus marinus TaxID=3115295 RepID=UPI0039066FA0
MSYFDEDFYHEPSEFDQLVDELKESLSQKVKEDFLSEMERLRKENAELQEIKANYKKIQMDFENKERQLEYDRSDLERKVRRERLSQLLKEFEVELYSVASTSKEQPKCNKCDEKRRIHYKTPLGRETYETCDCAERISTYEPIPIMLSEFSYRNGKASAWYRVKTDRSDEWLSYYEDSISGDELITDEKQFEDIGYAYRTLFKNKEIAQKYCDYKNSKEV